MGGFGGGAAADCLRMREGCRDGDGGPAGESAGRFCLCARIYFAESIL